ncbi:leucine-rich repeat protein [Microbacterium sp. TNHR37B]|uniref:leucine-rich repeat protein n=1 Tax=Microbacterium sp. TNHR37B TaxID=1775956 RepID=UPI0007B2A2DB|nr:leucine-rich repeat protein [Microbacterium sp. TNHR37B]KZE91397.1 hypothetical protein AVP41_00938 [Microbacterium sp. TNHR37B]
MRSRSRARLGRLLPVIVVATLAAVSITPPAVASPAAATSATSSTTAAAPTSVKSQRVGAYAYQLDTATRTATVTGWSGKRKKAIAIPAKITVGDRSYRVTRIGYGAFAGPVTYVLPGYSPVPATKLTLPEGIESIDDFAFYGNALPSVTIPKTVTWIGTSAFDQDRMAGASGWTYPLRKVTFRGNAPQMSELGSYIVSPGGGGWNGAAPFGVGNGFSVFYPKNAVGFTSPIWAGYLASPTGSASVPGGYGSRVKNYGITISPTALAGAKLTAKLQDFYNGSKFSPKPTSLTYRWELRESDGTWRVLSTKKTATLPRDSTGKVIRVLVIAKGPGTRKAVLQLGGVRTVLDQFRTSPTPRIILPAGKKKVTVGMKLRADGATASAWTPDADRVDYQWYRNGKAISKNGWSRTYKVVAADKGKKITVRVTGMKYDFVAKTRTSDAVTVAR